MRCQQLEQEFLAGQGLDAKEYTALTGSLVAVLGKLGMKRIAKDLPRLSDLMREAQRT
jgi:hypothetical protein